MASKAAPIDDMEQVPSTEFVAWLAPSQADAGAASIVEISGSFEEGAGSLSERLAIKAELSAIEEGIVPGDGGAHLGCRITFLPQVRPHDREHAGFSILLHRRDR